MDAVSECVKHLLEANIELYVLFLGKDINKLCRNFRLRDLLQATTYVTLSCSTYC